MNIIFLSPMAGGVEADQVQQYNVPHRTINKVEFENKSLKTKNAKFENGNDHLYNSRMKLSLKCKVKD